MSLLKKEKCTAFRCPSFSVDRRGIFHFKVSCQSERVAPTKGAWIANQIATLSASSILKVLMNDLVLIVSPSGNCFQIQAILLLRKVRKFRYPFN